MITFPIFHLTQLFNNILFGIRPSIHKRNVNGKSVIKEALGSCINLIFDDVIDDKFWTSKFSALFKINI